MGELDPKIQGVQAVDQAVDEAVDAGVVTKKPIDISKIIIAPDGTLLSPEDQKEAPLQDFAGPKQR